MRRLYQERRRGLGEEFATEIGEAIEMASEPPCGIRLYSAMCAVSRRFPSRCTFACAATLWWFSRLSRAARPCHLDAAGITFRCIRGSAHVGHQAPTPEFRVPDD